MNQDLFYLGLTHRSARPELRERLRFDESTLWEMLVDFEGLADERMILSTCERFEIYASGVREGLNSWLERLGEQFECAVVELAPQAIVRRGTDVASHFFRVAGGMESRLVGEPHILGQVRKAYLQAVECDTVGPILSALGRAAIHSGRRIRRETPINVTARSSATLAVDWVEGQLGAVADRTVLVVGTGRLATDVAACLANRRTGRILVVGRNLERADEFARCVGGEGLTLHQLVEGIRRADAVITCAASPTFLVDRRMMDARHHPVAIVDLGVPRNVDPAVGGISNVKLCHLDDLVDHDTTCAETMVTAETLVAQEVRRLCDWMRARAIAPEISALIQTTNMVDNLAMNEHRLNLHRRICALKAAVAA